MRAAFVREKGPPENICVDQLPDPQPGPGQVLVRVNVAAVNPVDAYLRSGSIAMDLPMPYIVGCDLAGVVAAVGPGVDDLTVGTRVWGSNQGLLGRQGTFAELAVVDRQWLYPTPADVSDEQAAATALVGVTAHLGLVEEGRLEPGQTVLVSGGSGAVGSTVIQMAKAIGARVVATTSSSEKADYCRGLGAEHVFDYTKDEIPTSVRQAIAEGVDLWWETSRQPNFDAAFGSLARGGRMIVMAGRDARPPFPVGPFYANSLNLHGFVMFLASPEAQARAADAINGWLSAGVLETRIDRIASLAETADLHRLQERSTVANANCIAGKLLVQV